MPPVSPTTRTTSLRKRRPHGKPPSAGTTSTQSSGSPKFERSEQRQRIKRPHLGGCYGDRLPRERQLLLERTITTSQAASATCLKNGGLRDIKSLFQNSLSGVL